MKIEKVNENQIKCTLTREDLETRHIKLSELAYGTEKAKLLFRDMMQQAFSEFGFEAEDIPLMIEAIPVTKDSIMLIVTKVEDPEELDTRFSRFAPHLKDEMDELLGLNGALSSQAEELMDLFRSKEEARTASAAQTAPKEDSAPSPLSYLFHFSNLDHVIDACHVLAPFFRGASRLYKDSLHGLYYLQISRGKTSAEEFNKACNILSEYGTLTRQAYQSSEYLEEHFERMIASDVISKLSNV